MVLVILANCWCMKLLPSEVKSTLSTMQNHYVHLFRVHFLLVQLHYWVSRSRWHDMFTCSAATDTRYCLNCASFSWVFSCELWSVPKSRASCRASCVSTCTARFSGCTVQSAWTHQVGSVHLSFSWLVWKGIRGRTIRCSQEVEASLQILIEFDQDVNGGITLHDILL